MANSNEEEGLLVNNNAEYGSFPQSITQKNNVGGDKKAKRAAVLKYSLIALVIVLLSALTFAIVSTVIIVPHAQEYVNQSVEFDIRHVEIESISTEGIFLRVGGVNKVNYDEIDSSYASGLFKLGGGLLKKASIDLQNVKVLTYLDTDKGQKMVEIGEIEIPEFQVNIRDGEITILNLLVVIHPKTAKALELIKNLIRYPDKIFKLFGSTTLNVMLGSHGFIPIKGIHLNFETEVVGNNYFLIKGDEIEINDLTISELENSSSYGVEFEVGLPNPLFNKFITFEVPKLQWDLFIEDCYEKPTIGIFDNIQTKNFKVSTKDENLAIKINATLNELNPELSISCKLEDENYTPLNHLIDQFLNNEEVPLMLQNYKGSEDYPGFVNEILTNLQFNIDYVSTIKLSELVDSVSMNNFKFEFSNGNINKPVINGELEIVINIPINSTTSELSNFQISQIKGSTENQIPLPIKLFNKDNEEFGEINFIQWHECENELIQDDNQLIVKFKLSQEELTITDKSIFGKVVNELLTVGRSHVFIDAMMDFLIDTLVGNFQINGLNIHSESEIVRSSIFNLL